MDTGAKWVTSEGGTRDDIRRRESWEGGSLPPHPEQAAASEPGSMPVVWFFKKKDKFWFLGETFSFRCEQLVQNCLGGTQTWLYATNSSRNASLFLLTFYFCRLCLWCFCFCFFFFLILKNHFRTSVTERLLWSNIPFLKRSAFFKTLIFGLTEQLAGFQLPYQGLNSGHQQWKLGVLATGSPGDFLHHLFFIHSSVDGHWGCFHVLAIGNSAAMNIEVHGSFWIMVFFW